MALDLTKPLRFKDNKQPVTFLHKLKGRVGFNLICVYTDPSGAESSYVFDEGTLENVPSSRWLNLYEGEAIANWAKTRECADESARGLFCYRRIGLVEDKQDGSTPIIHKV